MQLFRTHQSLYETVGINKKENIPQRKLESNNKKTEIQKYIPGRIRTEFCKYVPMQLCKLPFLKLFECKYKGICEITKLSVEIFTYKPKYHVAIEK